MPAYLVGAIRVIDDARWQQYVAEVGPTFAPHGGRLLFRGQRAAQLAGRPPGERIVVVEFRDLAALQAWHASTAYQRLIPLRDAAAEVDLTAYQA